MLKTDEDLDRARSTYRELRQIWLADGILDAHERLAVMTVAARLRPFAFLNHLAPATRNTACALLSKLGFQTRVFAAQFDLELEIANVSGASVDAYKKFKAGNERFFGLGVWFNAGRSSANRKITISNLGSALAYPECCVRMDLQTRRHDHRLFLRGLVNEVGDDPNQVRWGLRRKLPVRKASQLHIRKWERRYEFTLARFPFALHAACDECLKRSSSPTAILSATYETLAKNVSEELHFLIRWAAHIGSRGR